MPPTHIYCACKLVSYGQCNQLCSQLEILDAPWTTVAAEVYAFNANFEETLSLAVMVLAAAFSVHALSFQIARNYMCL